MTGFDDVHFPLRLARGAVGGPEYRTEILSLASGKEVRNAVWASSRRRWDVGGAVSDIAGLQVLINFFEARQGRLRGFRFRDPLDHSSAAPGAVISASDQVIGIGDDVTSRFALTKAYGAVIRAIAKPVISSIRVAVDDSELASGWSMDTATGEILFDVPPADGEVISAGFEFDCAVRFESDRIEGVIEAFDAGRIVSVGLVELA